MNSVKVRFTSKPFIDHPSESSSFQKAVEDAVKQLSEGVDQKGKVEAVFVENKDDVDVKNPFWNEALSCVHKVNGKWEVGHKKCVERHIALLKRML